MFVCLFIYLFPSWINDSINPRASSFAPQTPVITHMMQKVFKRATGFRSMPRVLPGFLGAESDSTYRTYFQDPSGILLLLLPSCLFFFFLPPVARIILPPSGPFNPTEARGRKESQVSRRDVMCCLFFRLKVGQKVIMSVVNSDLRGSKVVRTKLVTTLVFSLLCFG